MKRILTALLACVLVSMPILTGCGNANETGATTTTTPEITSPVEEPQIAPKDQKYDSITLGGVALSEYSIVYAPDELIRLKPSFPSSFLYGDTDYYHIIADELAAVLKEMTGITLNVIPDTEAESEHEILLGNTTRAQSQEVQKLGTYTYKLMMQDGKLSIDGGSVGAAYHALDALYASLAEQGSKDPSIPADYSLSAKADLITVACVGDSVTEGYGSTNSTYCAYPAVLQRILWKDYIVINYGNSGKTMRDDLADAYSKTATYSTLMRQVRNADITLIMLGTNDSNRDQNWTDADSETFNDSCKNLVAAIEEKRPGMTYFIMNCPVYSGNANFGSSQVRSLQKALVTSLAEEGYDMHFFDMYNYSRKTITLSLFDDGLHPNNKGYAMMADGVAKMLEEYRASLETDAE